MAQLLSDANTGVLSTCMVAQLTMDLQGRSRDVDIGLITVPGKLDNLSAGEAFIAPVEGKAVGKVIITPEGCSGLNERMTIHFDKGLVSDIEGGGVGGDRYRRALELPVEKCPKRAAELGIGTNPMARSIASTLESEKGRVYIAIGDNSHIGGAVTADLHQDFVVWEPSLALDDRPAIGSGRRLA